MKRYLLLSLLFLTVVLSAKTKIAVVNFKNNGQAEFVYLESGIAGMLSTNLAKSKELILVEREQISKLVSEMNLSASGLVDQASAVEIGKVSGAEKVVIGSFINLGKSFRIDAKVVDVATSEVIPNATASCKASDVENLDSAVDQLAESILKAFTGEQAQLKVNGEPGKKGKFELTYQNNDYFVLTDGEQLLPEGGLKAELTLSHGKHLFQIEKIEGIFSSKTVGEQELEVPGGYRVRAKMDNDKIVVYDLQPLFKKSAQESASASGSYGKLIIFSNEGMCDVFLDGQKKASLKLAMINSSSQVEIDEIEPGTYLLKIEGFDTWYEDKITIKAGEEIKIKTEKQKTEILDRIIK